MHTQAPAGLRAPRHRVHPRAIWLWTTRAAAGWIALIALEVVVLIVGEHHIAGWRYAVIAVTAALALAHVTVMPQWRYRVHRWELSEHAVYTQSGWFVQERRIAPVARIQTVDVHRGPFEQVFRLANVTVTTASARGPLKIHGLDAATADRIVEELTARIRAADGDAT
jgi:membrane protein YdbS with pleckstrin-like domain